MNVEWLSALPGVRHAAVFSAVKRKVQRSSPPHEIVHVTIPYRQWDGTIGPWAEHFGKGKKQVHSLDGSAPLRSCNEVEVVKLLRSVRHHAFWVSCYNPSALPAIWQPFALAPTAMPYWLSELDRRVRQTIPHRTGGIPDVVAWNNSESRASAVFVECKGPKEDFKESQEDWLSAAIECGIPVTQFAVAVRNFT